VRKRFSISVLKEELAKHAFMQVREQMTPQIESWIVDGQAENENCK